MPVNANRIITSELKEINHYYAHCQSNKQTLPHWIDGVVIKVNLTKLQERLGYSGKAPRFAVAYKLPAERATAQIKAITFQVGRTGVVTPVAILTPTILSGSTVQRATLHNQDFIQHFGKKKEQKGGSDIRVGDTVTIHKAGDIIPEVVDVILALRPQSSTPFVWPTTNEQCGGDGTIIRKDGESAWRCKYMDSPTIKALRIAHFASKTAFDIDGCGKKTVALLLDKGIIAHASDLFTLKPSNLKNLEGWRQKSISNLLSAIAARRKITLSRFLIALSIDGIGEETAMLLSHTFDTLPRLRIASTDDLTNISQIGLEQAIIIVNWFSDQENKNEIDNLLNYVTVIPDTQVNKNHQLNNKTIVITGSFEDYNRQNLKQELRNRGANITNAVTNKTDYLLSGGEKDSKKDSKKLEKAKELKVVVVGEEVLKEWLA